MKLSGYLWGAAAASLIGASLWVVLTPSRIAVETALVVRGRFAAVVEEDGQTRVRSRFLVSAPLAGRLERITLRPGDVVTAGQALAVIRPSPSPFLDPRSRVEAEARLGQAEAMQESAQEAVEQARARLDQAKREYERIARLVPKGSATPQQLEQASLAVSLAERELAAATGRSHAATHDVEQARAALARYDASADAQLEAWTVTSPIDGTVLRVAEQSETTVGPGQTLLEVADIRDLEIVTDVLTSDAVQIPLSAHVDIAGWGGASLVGRVRTIEPGAFTKISALGLTEQRVNVVIDITSPNEAWSAIGDGYRVLARIETFVLSDALQIPAGALYSRGDQWFTYVVRDGVAVETPLTVLRRGGDMAAVENGVSPGDEVILFPGDAIKAGSAVQPR